MGESKTPHDILKMLLFRPRGRSDSDLNKYKRRETKKGRILKILSGSLRLEEAPILCQNPDCTTRQYPTRVCHHPACTEDNDSLPRLLCRPCDLDIHRQSEFSGHL